MGLEPKTDSHAAVVDNFVNPIANYQMTTRDYVVRPSASPATGAITITLPPVGEAEGRTYGILVRDADGTNTVTVADKDDSEGWLSDITLSGANERVLLFSDGLSWYPMGPGSGDWPGFVSTVAPDTTVAPTTA